MCGKSDDCGVEEFEGKKLYEAIGELKKLECFVINAPQRTTNKRKIKV